MTVVGAGSVGSVLSLMLKRRGHSIVSVVSKTRKSAQVLAARVRCRTAGDDVSLVSPATTFLLITTPEHAVEQTALSIASLDLPFGRMAVAHTSGALSSDVLAPLAARGARTFSFHPIQTFPVSGHLSISLASMNGVWYGFEGPKTSRAFARALAGILRGKFLEIPKEKKILYHLACVFASNYPVVLLGAVDRLAQQVSGGDLTPFQKLFESSGQNAFQMGASKALTGPLSRGSVGIVHSHMAELGSKEPELLGMYSALGLFALEILKEKEVLSVNEINTLESLLAGDNGR